MNRGIRFEGRRYSVRLAGGRRLPAIFGSRADARAARDAHSSHQQALTIFNQVEAAHAH